MELGILAKTFVRPTLPEVLDAVAAHGLRSVQFNLSSVGLPTLPEHLEAAVVAHVRTEMSRRGISIAAVSGTFNMIDPSLAERQHGLRRLGVLASNCRALGASIITLCTGTRDPNDMWRRHPDNDSKESWGDLVRSLRTALEATEPFAVTLAFEPEVSNVIDSAIKARRLLDEIGSPRLKVVIDAANLFHAGELPRMSEILDQAFELLGRDIVLAHAKDLSHDGDAGHEAAGTGRLDYPRYLRLLKRIGFTGSLIIHGLREDQVGTTVAFLRNLLEPP